MESAFGLELKYQTFPGSAALLAYSTDFELASLHSRMSQFLKIIFCVDIDRHTLLVLFLWGTLTNVSVNVLCKEQWSRKTK